MSELQPIMVDTKQAAKLLGLKESTLRNWRCIGKGPEYVHVSISKNSKVLYPVSALQQWAASLTPAI